LRVVWSKENPKFLTRREKKRR